jgi:hypothetical protein
MATTAAAVIENIALAETATGTASKKSYIPTPLKPWHLSTIQGLTLVELHPGTVVSLDTIMNIFRDLNADQAKFRTTNLVCDLRLIIPDSEIGYKNLVQMVEHFRSLREEWWNHQRTALVVDSDIAFGLCRIYSSLMECNSDIEVRIFRNDFKAALDWAGQAA